MLAVYLPSKQKNDVPVSKTLILGDTKEALLGKKETKLHVLCEYQHK